MGEAAKAAQDPRSAARWPDGSGASGGMETRLRGIWCNDPRSAAAALYCTKCDLSMCSDCMDAAHMVKALQAPKRCPHPA